MATDLSRPIRWSRSRIAARPETETGTRARWAAAVNSLVNTRTSVAKRDRFRELTAFFGSLDFGHGRVPICIRSVVDHCRCHCAHVLSLPQNRNHCNCFSYRPLRSMYDGDWKLRCAIHRFIRELPCTSADFKLLLLCLSYIHRCCQRLTG